MNGAQIRAVIAVKDIECGNEIRPRGAKNIRPY
jgi:hypothetical protein